MDSAIKVAATINTMAVGSLTNLYPVGPVG
jgi:hypothetical protein